MTNQDRLVEAFNLNGGLRNAEGTILEGLVAIGVPRFVRIPYGSESELNRKEVQSYAPANAVAYVVGGDETPSLEGLRSYNAAKPLYGLTTTTKMKSLESIMNQTNKQRVVKTVVVTVFPVQFYGKR